jgi:GNAT superfamily N-acetyltransferase
MTSLEERTVRVVEAVPGDLDSVLPLSRCFYEHFDYLCDPAAKRDALASFLADPSLGRLFLASVDGSLAGYALVAFSFSLEYDGRTAFVDELFVAEGSRSQGVGAALLGHAADGCRALGVNALHLETEATNGRAAALYARLGFRTHGRSLMTKLLSSARGARP